MEKERIVMTTAEAAELTGVSVLTIRRLCRTGKLKYVKAGHGWLVNRASVAADTAYDLPGKFIVPTVDVDQM